VKARRIAIEAAVAAAIAFVLSLIVFGPLLKYLDSAWSGGDMLSTYVNSVTWGGFSYTQTTQFGFPLGMNLNYFPGIDITENTFAMVVNAVTGSTFLGINLLLLISFPLVAALAYLTIRMTGLQGPLAIVFAVAFTFVPYHFGRALGHTYLATLYSAVTGVALVLLIGSGRFERYLKSPSRRVRWWFIAALVVMAVVIAWTGVYYVAFTLILGMATLLWRLGKKVPLKQVALELTPFVGLGVLAVIGFIPSILTLRNDPPLASLGERLPYESVIFAGNLAMAILPLPMSHLPGFDFYNRNVVEAIAAAPALENTIITNFGMWVSSACLVIMIIGLFRRQKGLLPFIGYLTLVTVLFFVPWGLNYIIAGTLTAQIRAWNRFLPILLLLFILGASAVLARTRFTRYQAMPIVVAVVALGFVVIDSVVPFRQPIVDGVTDAAETTQKARDYATAVNAAIPGDCGILQLPYMAYPENGPLEPDLNDYDHFWPAITNHGKQWSYGSVKYTDASVWASQLPQTPTDAQVEQLRAAGFCGIHVDARGFKGEGYKVVSDDLTKRFGPAVASGNEDKWRTFWLGDNDTPRDPSTWPPELLDAFSPPMITPDTATVAPRGSLLNLTWWWTIAPEATFALTPVSPTAPLGSVSGQLRAPSCGPATVTATLKAGAQTKSIDIDAQPKTSTPFELTLDSPTTEPATLTISSAGKACNVAEFPYPQYAQAIDLTPRVSR
jgi:hypothetical protein